MGNVSFDQGPTVEMLYVVLGFMKTFKNLRQLAFLHDTVY